MRRARLHVRAAAGAPITVHPDGESVAGIPPGALLPGKARAFKGPAYGEWLAGADASALPV